MSVSYDILNALKTRLQAVNGLPNVVVRKRLMLLETDPLPLVVIALLEQSQDIRFRVFGKVAYKYNVGIALVEAGNREFETGLSSSSTLEQRIRDALQGVLLSGTEVWDTDITTNETTWMPLSGNAQNYQISTFMAVYSTLESVTSV
tara:strand:- start:6776 stop:7216 length:441 start_codon:yes stop_codon:yes gene_type:complete